MMGGNRWIGVMLGLTLAGGVAGGAVGGPREAGGSGVRSAGGVVVADLSAGGASGGIAVGGAVRLVPGYVGQLYDVRSLPLSVEPAEVPEGGAGQLAAGPAVMDDGTGRPVAAAEVRWEIVSGPVGAVSPSGVVSADEVAKDETATVSGTLLNLTAEVVFAIVDSAPALSTFASVYPALNPADDDNGDGLTNFTHYALGSNPLGQGPPANYSSVEGLFFTHTERTSAADVFPRYEYSVDLPTFSPMVEGVHYSVRSRVPAGAGTDRVTIEIHLDSVAEPFLVWRLAFASFPP